MKTLLTKLGEILCACDIHWFALVERRIAFNECVQYDACTRCSKLRITREGY